MDMKLYALISLLLILTTLVPALCTLQHDFLYVFSLNMQQDIVVKWRMLESHAILPCAFLLKQLKLSITKWKSSKHIHFSANACHFDIVHLVFNIQQF